MKTTILRKYHLHKRFQAVLLAVAGIFAVHAQGDGGWNAASGLRLDVEDQGVAATGDYAPLWLSSNRYGKVSTQNQSAYERVGVMRSEQNDSSRNWRLGYGVDLMLQQGNTSAFFVHQAYASIAYKKARLTIGAKEYPLDVKTAELTSGALSMGINARPIPQVKMEIDYFSIPGTKQWWKWKVAGGIGMTTDGRWQEDFSRETAYKYTTNHMYLEKRLFWKFGKEYHPVCPLTFEVGISMVSQFGGTSYHVNGRNTDDATIKHNTDFKAFWHALTWGGSDATDGTESNVEGNQLGSYNMVLAWTTKDWMVRAYAERYFDDQSMITFQYGVQDHLLGFEGRLPKNPFLSGIVLEHLSTRNQSGAILHDASPSIPDKMNGRDNYYNHNNYEGWQHWGMGCGTPLLTSPIYNRDGLMLFKNNRVKAWHLALSGDPTDEIHWRMLLTLTENWGTYSVPFVDKKLQQYFLGEVSYAPKFLKGWSGKLGLAYDHGNVLGNSFGGQLTIRKTINLVK